MCLAVPGQIVSIEDKTPSLRVGKVNFSGVLREANLSFVPDAKVGDFVIVHVGFALNKVDQKEAEKVLEYLAEINELGREELGSGGAG